MGTSSGKRSVFATSSSPPTSLSLWLEPPFLGFKSWNPFGVQVRTYYLCMSCAALAPLVFRIAFGSHALLRSTVCLCDVRQNKWPRKFIQGARMRKYAARMFFCVNVAYGNIYTFSYGVITNVPPPLLTSLRFKLN